jgi:hypothetical protein
LGGVKSHPPLKGEMKMNTNDMNLIKNLEQGTITRDVGKVLVVKEGKSGRYSDFEDLTNIPLKQGGKPLGEALNDRDVDILALQNYCFALEQDLEELKSILSELLNDILEMKKEGVL